MTSTKTDMDNSDDDTDKIGWYFLFAFLIVLVGVDIVNWENNFFYKNNYHSYFVGFIMWLVFFMQDQIIIDKNLFAKYGLISFGIFLILLVKQFLTTLSYPAIMASLYVLPLCSLKRRGLFKALAKRILELNNK